MTETEPHQRDEQGRVDRDKEPSWEWLEQVAREESVLAVRTDDAGEVREFRVEVEELDLKKTMQDIEADEGIDIGTDKDIYEEAEELVREMEAKVDDD